jgi:preprotein translocase subunit SecG
LIYVLYILEVLVCLFLILVVLLQQGSGADLSVFGGGATQTAFGARGTTQFIHKLTVWAFIAFILLTLAIAVMKGGNVGRSVITGADPTDLTEPAAPAPAGPAPAAPAARQAQPGQGQPAPAQPAPAAPAQSAPGAAQPATTTPPPG